MDIAALSTSLSQVSLSQSVGIQVLSMAKSQAEQQGQNLVKLMDTANLNPNLGHSLDIRV
ncbi:YjfB family protein [Paenibacillus sp. GCM10027627]|uniref:YjfB family protein n=1 Tax=unclassified Paenibacillus TaxID=185978 RepID=UPI00363F8A14